MTQWGVDAIFNPSKRHMDEEKRRLQATRQEVGDNSGGRRIDLMSGKVRIARQPSEAGPDAEADPAEADPAAEAAAETGSGPECETAAETAAEATEARS